MLPSNAIETEIVPRVSETDGAGHINNITSAIWFEAGRRQIFCAITPELSFDRWAIALLSMEIRYRRQIYLASEVTVMTWVRAIGNTSFRVNEAILQNGEICAVGRCVYVHMDYSINKSKPIPDDARLRLHSHLADTPQFDQEFTQ